MSNVRDNQINTPLHLAAWWVVTLMSKVVFVQGCIHRILSGSVCLCVENFWMAMPTLPFSYHCTIFYKAMLV